MKLKSIFLSATSLISLSATVFFAVANAAFAESYEYADNISAISVAVADNLLDGSDVKTRYTLNESGELIAQSYYDIYSYDNLILEVSYTSGEKISYSGAEIASLTAKTGVPFIISDSQAESSWSIGTYTVTCSFADKTADISFTVKENDISSVSVTPLQDISFIKGLDGEEKTIISDSGDIAKITEYPLKDQLYAINISYADGSSARYTLSELLRNTDHSITFAQPEGELSAGTHIASCYVDGIKADFSFTIAENTIEKIELYMTDNADVLDFSTNGITDYDKNGKPYPRFLIDKSKIKGTVYYTDGTEKVMSLSQLCILLDDSLLFNDSQENNPFNKNKVTVSCSIRNIPCSLTFDINAKDVTEISAGNITSSKAELSWDRVYCAGYELYSFENGAWKKLYDLPFGTESVTLSGLLPDESYKYAVRSYIYSEDGTRIKGTAVNTTFKTSPWDEEITAATKNITDTSADISWNKSEYADGYMVYILENSKWRLVEKISDKNITACTVSGLSSVADYSVCVKAYKNDDSGVIYRASKAVKFVTLPEEIRNPIVTDNTESSVTLNWDKNENADGYIVYIYKDSKWQHIAVLKGNENTSYTAQGLDSTSAHTFSVKAFKNHRSGTIYSSPVKIIAYTLPEGVQNFTVTDMTESSLTIGWDKLSGASGYALYSLDNGSWVQISDLSADNTSYTLSGLKAGTAKKFSLKAYILADDKYLYSSPVTLNAVTLPEAVSGLTLSEAQSDSVTAVWNVSKGADGYIVNIFKDGKWPLIKRITSPDEATVLIKELSPDTEYKIYVKAFKINSGKTIYGEGSIITVRTAKAT